jgi:hypothetical protein
MFGLCAVIGAALSSVFLAVVWRAVHGPSISPKLGGLFVLLAVGGDLAFRHNVRIARPLAVFRQVPRAWGHEAGPWRAAARYGLRMGVGPATILVSWSWWVGTVLVVATGPAGAVFGATAFAAARTIAMALATGDVDDGVAMARRSLRLNVAGGVAMKLLTLIMFVIGSFAIAGLFV